MTDQPTGVLMVDDHALSRLLFSEVLASARHAVERLRIGSTRFVTWRRHDSTLSLPTFPCLKWRGWNF